MGSRGVQISELMPPQKYSISKLFKKKFQVFDTSTPVDDPSSTATKLITLIANN